MERRDTLLRHTFVHLPGIGYATEARLWSEGFTTWDEFFARREDAPVGPVRGQRLEEGLPASREALAEGDHRFFRRRLPGREHWRAYPDFKEDVAYLDIETTGMEADRDAITVVGVYDGRETRFFLPDDLGDLPEALDRYRVLVTFNGATFDLPFLRRSLPDLRFHQIHIDLRYLFARLGMKGGLKSIEKRLRIERSPETADIRGWDAVYLWRRYEQGDEEALDLLLRYNGEDVRNLEPLLEIAYDALRGRCLDDEFRTYSLADATPSVPPPADPA